MIDSALEDKQLLQNRKITLEDQLQDIQSLDSEILRLLEDIEDLEEDVLLSEIEEAGLLRTEMKESIRRLEEALIPVVESEHNSVRSIEDEQALSRRNVRVKLSKLELQKFDGKIEHWQEFWDSFCSSVDQNAELSDVDKFSYLRGLLKDKAKDSISGYALTAAIYEVQKNS
ncbi:uncharacterized protein LOC124459588 [Xenia sp. Carnegie-2017]|uniref:uncharacterized protein LOC124459588 n=1 Tax=Xenia sp. Carnegie-2017 TaxID=2897299 RepID=UPI001F0435F0|nr:uncharacterized protein LOC124459588 [Xenia sp. Carnegie-2017]